MTLLERNLLRQFIAERYEQWEHVSDLVLHTDKLVRMIEEETTFTPSRIDVMAIRHALWKQDKVLEFVRGLLCEGDAGYCGSGYIFKKPLFMNKDRIRYYGLRVGDMVNPYNTKAVYTVAKLDLLDNNRIVLQSSDPVIRDFESVAEWCTVLTPCETLYPWMLK